MNTNRNENTLEEVSTGYRWEVRSKEGWLRAGILYSEWSNEYAVTSGNAFPPIFNTFEEALEYAEKCEYAEAFRDGWAPSVKM